MIKSKEAAQVMKIARVELTRICVSLIIVSLIFPCVSFAKINLEDLAGLWLFDDDGGDTAIDSSGNGNDAEVADAVKWIDGVFGGALEFDGTDDFVEVPDSDSLDITDAITIVAWVNPYEVADQGIVTKRVEEGNEGVYCFASPYAAQAVLGVAINTAWVRPFRGELETEVWQFVAFTYDGSNTLTAVSIAICQTGICENLLPLLQSVHLLSNVEVLRIEELISLILNSVILIFPDIEFYHETLPICTKKIGRGFILLSDLETGTTDSQIRAVYEAASRF